MKTWKEDVLSNEPQEAPGLCSEAGRIDLFLSRRLVGVRETKGVSMESLAAQLDMSPGTLGEFESGARKIPALLLFMMSQALCVSLSEIFNDELPARQYALEPE